jgi:hypothetical protein
MVYKRGLHTRGPWNGSPPRRCEGPAPDFAITLSWSSFDSQNRKDWRYNSGIGGTCMRIFGLLVLSCGLVTVCGAVDQVRQGASSQTAVASFKPDFERSSGIVRPDFSGMATGDRGDRDRRRLDSDRDGDVTCYTIESYLVKRQGRDSDVVEPAGHSTCQRASRYGVKKVEGQAPSH